jgi:hypothetical protein
MSHPLVLALFPDPSTAAGAVRALRELGLDPASLSIVLRSHDQEVKLARQVGATPGAEIEDSRPAARLGELGGQILAAIALVMPGIGPIVSAGPLAADLGEAAGHLAGGIVSVLRKAGLGEEQAGRWQSRLEEGAVVLGAHTTLERVDAVRQALSASGADEIERAEWR